MNQATKNNDDDNNNNNNNNNNNVAYKSTLTTKRCHMSVTQ